MAKITFDEIVDTLGLNRDDFNQWKARPENFLLHQVRRQIRYACFSMQREEVDGVPDTFIEYYESQPHFSGWELFADRWDVKKDNPLITYPRTFSIHEEWDAELRMAVPELPGAISYKQGE